MGGYIVRDGGFDYKEEGVKYKDWNNIQDSYKGVDYAIAYGSKTNDSHLEQDDRNIGYFDSFVPVLKGTKGPYKPYIDNDFNRMAAAFHTFKPITEISDLQEGDLFELPVSQSYDDIGKDNRQVISRLHHIAVSLNKSEIDRCSTLRGSPCNVSIINEQEVS